MIKINRKEISYKSLMNNKVVGKIGDVKAFKGSITKQHDQKMISLCFYMDKKFLLDFAGIGMQYDNKQQEQRFNEFLGAVCSQFVRDFVIKVEDVRKYSIAEDVAYGFNWEKGVSVISFEFKPDVPNSILNTTIDYVEDYFSDPEFEYVMNIMSAIDSYMMRISKTDFVNFLYRNDYNNIGFATSRLDAPKHYYINSTNRATVIFDSIITHREMLDKLKEQNPSERESKEDTNA